MREQEGIPAATLTDDATTKDRFIVETAIHRVSCLNRTVLGRS
ncbi:hypothetical protein [Nostoc sp.]